jgi:hypothetical protein
MAGQGRVKLTVVDIDAHGPEAERWLGEVQNQYGPPKVVVRTGRGGFHCHYRHDGEGRKIRPELDKPIDILGGGVVILPPSKGLVRDYEYIEGGIDDLVDLPVIRKVANDTGIVPASRAGTIREGQRNRTLWEHGMRAGHHCDDYEAMLDVVRTRNDDCLVPLGDKEVERIAKSVWGYTERGENRFGQTGVWFPTQEVNSLIAVNPDAFMLLSFLKANNSPHATFMVANSLDDTFG